MIAAGRSDGTIMMWEINDKIKEKVIKAQIGSEFKKLVMIEDQFINTESH